MGVCYTETADKPNVQSTEYDDGDSELIMEIIRIEGPKDRGLVSCDISDYMREIFFENICQQ